MTRKTDRQRTDRKEQGGRDRGDREAMPKGRRELLLGNLDVLGLLEQLDDRTNLLAEQLAHLL
jgi:hypothetical protein